MDLSFSIHLPSSLHQSLDLPLLDLNYVQITDYYSNQRFIPRFTSLLRDLVDRRQYRLVEYFISRVPASYRSDIFEICLGSRQEELLPILQRVFPRFDLIYLSLYGVSANDEDATFYRKLLEIYRPTVHWPLLQICQLSNLSLLLNYLKVSFNLGCEIKFSSVTSGAKVLRALISHIPDPDPDRERDLEPDPLLEEIWDLLVAHNFYLETFAVPGGYLFLLLEAYFKKPQWVHYLLRRFKIEISYEDITPLLTLQIKELLNFLGEWDKYYRWIFLPQISMDSFQLTYVYPVDRRLEVLNWLLSTFPAKYHPVKLLYYLASLEEIPSALLDRLAIDFQPITPRDYFETYPQFDLRGYYELRDLARQKRMGKFILDETSSLAEPFTTSLEEVVRSERIDLVFRSLAADLQRLYATTHPRRIWRLTDLQVGRWIVLSLINKREIQATGSLVKVTGKEVKDGYIYLNLTGIHYWTLIQPIDSKPMEMASYYHGICPKNEIYFVEVDSRPFSQSVNLIILGLERIPNLRTLCKIKLGAIEKLDVQDFL